MKKIFLLIALVSIGAFSQTNPSVFKNGIDTKLIALDTLTTVQRDALTLKSSKGYVIFNATTNTLNVHNGTSWGEVTGGGGSSTTPTLQQVTTQGATTSNNITIANNNYPRLAIDNLLTYNTATFWDNSIVYSYPGGHNLSLLKPASFTGNYSLSIPAITANDTIALKSELVGLGGNYARLDINNTFLGSQNNFNGKIGLNDSSPSVPFTVVDDVVSYASGRHILNSFSDIDIANNAGVGGVFSGYWANGTSPTAGFLNSLGGLPLWLGTLNTNGDVQIEVDGTAHMPNATIVEITSRGAKAILTKEAADSYYSGSAFDPSAPQTIIGAWSFKNKLLLESLINGYLGGFKITNDGIMEIGDTELQDLSVRIKSFSGLSQINLGDGQINVVGDFNVGGSMVASSFIGDGSGLTGLPSIPTTYAASNITVADAGGLITATTVEGALAENRGLINTNASNIASHETRLDDLEAVTPVNTAFRTVTPSAGVFTEAYNEAQPNFSFTITQNTAVTLTTIANGDFGIVEVINSTTTPYIVQLNGITNRTRTVTNETVSFTYTTNATGVTWYENYKTQSTSGSGESTNYAAQTGSGTSVINFTDNNFVDITLTANEVPTFTAPSATTRDLTLYVRQDATGGRTFTFPTYEWGFAGGTRPTITSTPNALDIFKIDYLSGKYYVTSVMQNLVAVDTPLSYTIEARINSGGTTITATDGEINYEANFNNQDGVNYGFTDSLGTGGVFGSAGVTWIKDASIPVGLPTADYDALYDDLRYGDASYTFPKGNGTYKVTLYLAEDQAAQTVGGRVFDVIIDGVTVETGVDVRNEFGIGQRAVAKVYDNIVITDGVLNLTTNSTTNLVLVAGIQIEKQD